MCWPEGSHSELSHSAPGGQELTGRSEICQSPIIHGLGLTRGDNLARGRGLDEINGNENQWCQLLPSSELQTCVCVCAHACVCTRTPALSMCNKNNQRREVQWERNGSVGLSLRLGKTTSGAEIISLPHLGLSQTTSIWKQATLL